MSFFTLKQTYQLETEKSTDYIIATLRSIIELNKNKKGLTTFFRCPDYSAILINNGKIIIEVITGGFQQTPIGEINISLFAMPKGTTIIAESNPYSSQIKIPMIVIALTVLPAIIIYINLQMHLPISSLIFLSVFCLLLYCCFIVVAVKTIKLTMKNYLERIFYNLHIDGKFSLMQQPD